MCFKKCKLLSFCYIHKIKQKIKNEEFSIFFILDNLETSVEDHRECRRKAEREVGRKSDSQPRQLQSISQPPSRVAQQMQIQKKLEPVLHQQDPWCPSGIIHLGKSDDSKCFRNACWLCGEELGHSLL